MTSTDDCQWFEGGFSVICRSEGKTPAGPTKSIGILGYSPEEKVYTYYGVDNTNMTMASVPKGTIQGDTWTYNDEGMMGGKKFKTRSRSRSSLPRPTPSKWKCRDPTESGYP